MADILIELDDEVIERLKAKARVNGRSLEDEVRTIVIREACAGQSRQLSPEERVRRSDQIRSMQAKPTSLLSEDIIRRHRDGGA